VGVIREEGPGVDCEGAGVRQHREPGHEGRPVWVVHEEHLAGKPPHQPWRTPGASRCGPRDMAGEPSHHLSCLAWSPVTITAKVCVGGVGLREGGVGFPRSGPLRAAGRGSYGAVISLHCLPAAERVFGSSRVRPPGINPVPTMAGRPLGSSSMTSRSATRSCDLPRPRPASAVTRQEIARWCSHSA
jgi:hypothetical protein